MSPVRPDLVECWVFRVGEQRDIDLLLLKRAPGRAYVGLWQPVTGLLEPGERVPLGALREVEEETAFGPSDIEAIYDLDQTTTFYEEGPDALITSALFAVRVGPGAEPTTSDEHDAHRWATPEESVRLAIWPSYRSSIDRIVDHLMDPERAPWFELDREGRRIRR
ncbi:MAG: NUDIX domain-containing protein [Chloroflexota bacterium]